jgi:Na+-transporting methylmalonyl-CoA/oxaloacetate decarboxylase gamma subunit
MENLGWGLQTTLLGMGLVFAMLALLWGLLALLLRLDGPVRPPVEPSLPARAGVAPAEGASAAGQPELPDPALRAAITVAVLWHRQVLRGEAAPAMRIHPPGALLHASRWVDAGRMRQNRVWRRSR